VVRGVGVMGLGGECEIDFRLGCGLWGVWIGCVWFIGVLMAGDFWSHFDGCGGVAGCGLWVWLWGC